MSLLDRYSDFVKERGKKTKVALVGAGQMGQGIVTQINKMPDTDLVLIVDKNEEKLDMAEQVKASEVMYNKTLKDHIARAELHIETLLEINEKFRIIII